MYSCPYCNRAKGDTWLGASAEIPIVDNNGFIDPCDSNYGKSFKRLNDGKIKPLTPVASFIYDTLKLYLKRHETLYMLEELNEKHRQLKAKIENKKNNGENTEKLEKIRGELATCVLDYYDTYRGSWRTRL